MTTTTTRLPTRRTRAVVVGASMAGLFAARALHDHVDEVLVLEREQLDDTAHPEPRGHVPQGRHAHALLAGGLQQAMRWFPGIDAELRSAGAVELSGEDVWWHQAGSFRVRGDWGERPLSMTRPLLEGMIRRRLVALPGVQLRTGVAVRSILHEQGQVVGVLASGASPDSGHDLDRVRADLVVDCSGRHSRLVQALAEDRLLTPPVERVGVDLAYGSRLLLRTPLDLDGTSLVVAADATRPADRAGRSAVVLPVEGDRWIVSLAGMFGDAPPTSDEGFAAFARTLPTPAVAHLLERCMPLGPVASFRLPSSQWRHFERVPALPGLVVLGDAVASFNPVYGQGMTSAALQAAALEEAVAAYGPGSARTATAAAAGAARVVRTPWSIAVGADFTHARTEGERPRGAGLVNAHFRRVLQAAHTSLPVARELASVQSLLAPPSRLFAPNVAARAWWAARRSPARGPSGAAQPVVGPARPVAVATR